MPIVSFAVRSLCDLANALITFWSSSHISHDIRTVREHARISSAICIPNFHLERAKRPWAVIGPIRIDFAA
jgi:hypothetical protein